MHLLLLPRVTPANTAAGYGASAVVAADSV